MQAYELRGRGVPADEAAVCGYMKMITPAKLIRCLETGRDEVEVPRDISVSARRAIDRMLAIAPSDSPA